MKAFAMSLMLVPTFLLAQEPRPIELDEAVRLARRNAPAAVQARNSIRTSAAVVRYDRARERSAATSIAITSSRPADTRTRRREGNAKPKAKRPYAFVPRVRASVTERPNVRI